MQHSRHLLFLLFPLLAIYLSSCSSTKEANLELPAELSNPHPIGSYEHFTARQDYPSTYDAWQNVELVKNANGKNSKLVIYLNNQRAKMFVNGQTALDFPVCTGVKSFPTKKGSYTIISKKENHKSNLYGTIYDANNNGIVWNADTTKDTIPEGGRFSGASMPYFMRLTNAGLGLHVGKVGRRPLSHGCIRVQREICKLIFQKTSIGTPVAIVQ